MSSITTSTCEPETTAAEMKRVLRRVVKCILGSLVAVFGVETGWMEWLFGSLMQISDGSDGDRRFYDEVRCMVEGVLGKKTRDLSY